MDIPAVIMVLGPQRVGYVKLDGEVEVNACWLGWGRVAKALYASGQEFCRPAETFGSNYRFALANLKTTTTVMSTAPTKRKRSDNADAGDHGRKNKQYKQFPNRPRPSQNHGSRHTHPRSSYAKSGDGEEEEAQKSINKLKSRIRDLRRSLAHVDSDPKNRMPQGIRIERERELESARHELEEKEIAKREAKFRNDIIGKYHMVRFFGEQSDCSFPTT